MSLRRNKHQNKQNNDNEEIYAFVDTEAREQAIKARDRIRKEIEEYQGEWYECWLKNGAYLKTNSIISYNNYIKKYGKL